MDTFESMIDKVPEEDLPEKLPMDETLFNMCQMLSVGKTTTYIAGSLGKSEAWVRQHKKDPVIIAQVNSLHNESVEAARAVLVSGTTRAAETIVELVENGPATIRLAAAKDMLDRIGMRAPDRKQIETTVRVNNVPREERMAAIMERAARLGLKFEEGAREVEFTEVQDE